MKHTTILLFFILIISCSSKFSYYHGYVCNEIKQPVEGLEFRGDFHPSNNKIYSNKKGYFKIEQKKWVNIFIYVYERGRLIDSIQTIGTSGGEQLRHYFIEGRNDTLFVRTDWNKN